MKRALWLLVLIIALAAFVACAPAATPAPPAPPVIQTVIVAGTPQVVVVTPTPVPPTAAPTKKPVGPKDTIVLAMSQEPDTLNPYIGSMMARTLVLQAIDPPPVLQDNKANWVSVWLAGDIPTLANGGAKFVGTGADMQLVVTMKTKPGLKYSDGTPFTAKDQVFGWKMFMDPDFPASDRSFSEKIYKIEAPDDNTYVVSFMSENQALAAAAGTLKGDVNFAAFKADYGPDGSGFDQWKDKGPVVDPLYFTADYHMPSQLMKNMKAADVEKSDLSKKWVGVGAYKLNQWQPAQQITLDAVPDSVLKPSIQHIVFRFITDASAELAALQNGEIDGATQIGLDTDSAPDLDKLAKDTWRVDYTPGYQWEHVELNMSRFPFNDLKVRQALAYATNKKAVTDQLYYGKVKPAYDWLPDFHWAFLPEAATMYPYDVAKAKQLLADAGYDCKASPCVSKDKKPLAFTLVTTDRKDRQALGQVLQAQWKAVGFGVNLQFLYGRGLFATCTSGTDAPLYCRNYDAAMFTWLSGDDPDASSLYTCKSVPTKENGWAGQNYSGICDKALDADLNKGYSDYKVAIDRDARKPIYLDAQKIWLGLVPVIPLKANANVTVWNVHLQGPTGVPTQSGETWNVFAWKWVP
ncbi:MAG: peptide ABC transporter substrate-binding protein [Chloroflexota bacterium]|nr:peptide ABC transporter substrate-binding protein [Chloroflexota bacterium]